MTFLEYTKTERWRRYEVAHIYMPAKTARQLIAREVYCLGSQERYRDAVWREREARGGLRVNYGHS